MSTPYPATSLDTTTTLPTESASTVLATNHVTAHTNLADAVIALETKVGVDSSAVTTTHDYKLGEILTTDKAVGKTATQTLTNKTLTSPVINVTSDATGDLYYRNAGGLFTRLPIGTATHILNVTGGIPAWRAETALADASTTVKGVVEAATSAEVTAGTATGATGAVLVVTPDALASSTPVFDGTGLTGLALTTLFANGVTTRAGDTASGDQTIAHGLARTPKKIRIVITKTNTTSGGLVSSVGTYNGTTNSCVYGVGYDNGNGSAAPQSGNSATQVAYVPQTRPGATGTQVAVATFDGTNITLTWTLSGTVNASNMNIMWEAEA